MRILPLIVAVACIIMAVLRFLEAGMAFSNPNIIIYLMIAVLGIFAHKYAPK